MSDRIQAVQAQALPILRKYQVKRASLFGSILRDDFQPDHSDVDLLVEFSTPQSLFGFLRLKVELEKKLQKSVDVVEYDSLKPRISAQVLSSAVSIL
jgi:uncharacterized protein